MAPKWKFQAQPDVFVELADLEAQYPDRKVATQPGLGLLPARAYPSDDARAGDQRDWVRFAAYVRWLNARAPEGVAYKVLYLTRHGYGYHNKRRDEVGAEAWNAHWSFLDGAEDGSETWFDARLTAEGEQQAHALAAFWRHLTRHAGAPVPQTLYTSPLARCLQTTHLMFAGVAPGLRPVVKEGLRERVTGHTCDLRRSAAWIRAAWPACVLEPGFAEADPVPRGSPPETHAAHVARKQRVLEDLWETDPGHFLALTVHSYAIQAVQVACGAPMVRTREGTSLALLVRGERLAEE